MKTENGRSKQKYIVFYKPYGVLSQFTGLKEEENLSFFNLPSHIYAAGRLDKDSEGLLFLTNDGQLIHKMLHPQGRHPRTYWVQVEGNPSSESLKRLSQGVIIQGYKTLPCRVSHLKYEPMLPARNPPIRFRKNIPTTWLEMTLYEGKNRQVRRMTAGVSHPTLRLVRVAMGGLRLFDFCLHPGEWREVGAKEKMKLLEK